MAAVVSIDWCRGKGHGLRLIEPNENLAWEYLRSADETLGILACVERSPMWLATAKYYCEYFAFYAVMMRLGIKSEIHECTIAVAGLLSELGLVPPSVATTLDEDKRLRIDNQYYLKNREVAFDAASLVAFVLGMKRVVLTMTDEQVARARRSFQ